MKILNDHNGNIDGTIQINGWEADLLCEALVILMGDIPEEHDDLKVAADLHKKMHAVFQGLLDQ